MNLLAFKLIQPQVYEIIFISNKVVLGKLYPEIDGEYVFTSDIADEGGFWSWPVLEEITNKLKKLNAVGHET